MYGPDIPGATQNALPPPSCLLLLLTCRLPSQSQANSSQTWLYAPSLLHWSRPTCCPLLALFTHIRLSQVRYGMPTVSESLYLTSSKACLAWSETWLSDDQSSFLKGGMPAHEAFFNLFFLKLSQFYNWGNGAIECVGIHQGLILWAVGPHSTANAVSSPMCCIPRMTQDNQEGFMEQLREGLEEIGPLKKGALGFLSLKKNAKGVTKWVYVEGCCKEERKDSSCMFSGDKARPELQWEEFMKRKGSKAAE